MSVTIQKKNLIIYLAFLVAAIVYSSFYGGPLSYGVLYALLLIVPVSILYIIINYRCLCVYQEVDVHKLTKGEEHKYRILIENAGPLPIHEMKLGVYEDRCVLYEIKDGDILSLKSFEKKELKSGINCLYAGAYDIGLETVTFKSVFNIFTAELDVPYSFRAIVSPRITAIADKVLDLENLVNSTGFKSTHVFEDTPGSDLRSYQTGDALSSINWKVTARLSELMVRTPERMEKRSVTILVEAANVEREQQNMDFLKRRDYMLEFLVSAAWHFGNQGVPIKLIYPSGTIVERLVDSYESFMEFYSIVADSIFYDSNKAHEEIKQLAGNIRERTDEMETWIILKEDSSEGEDIFTICG
ncbi:Protein of unknown function DUF58 [Pseudobutyrivibrio sp. YE44]|uniref:DUF58 domain-containing protein n=1 Tax=Pseudobutyrivibrio sp. YE44 TaxID=1520802 RepID=UPI00087FC14F|nr:DUF58 domain-containing protein [Pseudobutyrivibrio sp. YE44]SDB31168.1 Protein of unknown function DUF58 [Pseudobutyrivibrio sp. YE44]